MKTKIVTYAIMFAIFVSACKREQFQNDTTTDKGTDVSIDKLVVPKGFNFTGDKEVSVAIKVLGKQHPDERFVICLYRTEPNPTSLISSGATDAESGEYHTQIKVPKTQKYLWVERISNSGVRVYQKIPANAKVNHVFTDLDDEKRVTKKSSSGLSCTANCTDTYNNHSGNINITNGKVACFTGTISGNITVQNGGAAKICATGTIGNLKINGSGRVYILESATINAASIKVNSANAELFLWSDSITVNGNVEVSGFAENHGKLTVNGNLQLNSNAEWGNFGSLTVNAHLHNNNTFTNYGRVTVNGTFKNNSGADYFNYCNIKVNNNLENNGVLYNGRLVKVMQTFTQNSSGKTELDNVGLLSVKNLTVNGTIEGTGISQAVVKVTQNTTINGSGILKGKVDLCDDNGVENNWGQVQAPAAISCGGYIPVCACDTEGFGTPQIDDDDGDGIANNQDDYPDDPLRAFNSYIPCFNVCYTIAYEDLWPAVGDYDYNDLVMKFSVHKVLNASNKVVDLKFLVQPLAVGASYQNGFGFCLDKVSATAVQSVTGQSLTKGIIQSNPNGTEAEQDNAIIICFDTPEPLLNRVDGGFFNTQMHRAKGTSLLQTVVVTFETPVADELLGIDDLNPFIFTNGRRGYEVHLDNHMPTKLADMSLFGTGNDRSNPSAGEYYHTANGLPWGFMLECDFDYPIEKTPITTAYNYFDDWVLSNGTQYPNWYRNFPQYRDNNYIYLK